MEASSSAAPRGLGRTRRRDAWWLYPAGVVAALTAFTVYSVFAIAVGADYLSTEDGARYLSPFYSPNLDELFGIHPPFSFAFLVVWAPLGLRLTCYYYRKAYYRSFFLAPPACAVGGPKRRRYRGETTFPWVLQNVHRYFFYFATIVLAFLWYDAGRAFFFTGSDGSLEPGVGLGSLVLLTNVVLLSAFTFGCNSFRHLVGGKLDCFACSPGRHRLWLGVSVLNGRHALWAWISLVVVALADLYVRLSATGVIDDPRII
ncbi:MAG TPA: hypothetical protein VFO03_06790 [Gaiellaceae bacterium]|nr:hypothetical protein [Gaiellaceae bacterium]